MCGCMKKKMTAMTSVQAAKAAEGAADTQGATVASTETQAPEPVKV